MNYDDREIENIINTIPYKDWEKLTMLIPEIERTKVFGEIAKPEKQLDGSFTFPHLKPAGIVEEFSRTAYEIGIVIPFDWGEWEEGVNHLNNPLTDYSKLSLTVLCKLLTTIIRSDRFIEGNLYRYFKNGIILKILKAINEKAADKSSST